MKEFDVHAFYGKKLYVKMEGIRRAKELKFAHELVVKDAKNIVPRGKRIEMMGMRLFDDDLMLMWLYNPGIKSKPKKRLTLKAIKALKPGKSFSLGTIQI